MDLSNIDGIKDQSADAVAQLLVDVEGVSEATHALLTPLGKELLVRCIEKTSRDSTHQVSLKIKSVVVGHNIAELFVSLAYILFLITAKVVPAQAIKEFNDAQDNGDRTDEHK